MISKIYIIFIYFSYFMYFMFFKDPAGHCGHSRMTQDLCSGSPFLTSLSVLSSLLDLSFPDPPPRATRGIVYRDSCFVSDYPLFLKHVLPKYIISRNPILGTLRTLGFLGSPFTIYHFASILPFAVYH